MVPSPSDLDVKELLGEAVDAAIPKFDGLVRGHQKVNPGRWFFMTSCIFLPSKWLFRRLVNFDQSMEVASSTLTLAQMYLQI